MTGQFYTFTQVSVIGNSCLGAK